jgi:hypothetical protein
VESGESLRPSVPTTTSGSSARAVAVVAVLVAALVVTGIGAIRSYGPIEWGWGLVSAYLVDPPPLGG